MALTNMNLDSDMDTIIHKHQCKKKLINNLNTKMNKRSWGKNISYHRNIHIKTTEDKVYSQ